VGLMDRGMAAHARRKKVTDGRWVTYTRGTEAINLTAWLDEATSRRLTEDPAAVAVTASEKTFVFSKADLVIGGAEVLPQKDDRITETIDGQDIAFELRPTQDDPGWNWFDINRTMLIVRMTRVKVK